MPKYRVYELAKMFGKTNEEVIDILKKNQYEVTRAVNSVDEKAKEILDRELAAKKPAKKPAFRTVRFDSKGRPQDGRKTQGQGGFSASYSTDGAEQEARAAAMKKAGKARRTAARRETAGTETGGEPSGPRRVPSGRPERRPSAAASGRRQRRIPPGPPGRPSGPSGRPERQPSEAGRSAEPPETGGGSRSGSGARRGTAPRGEAREEEQKRL